MSNQEFELRPFRADRRKSAPEPLDQTAFRCGVWSVRGPRAAGKMGWRDTLFGVALVSAFGALGLLVMALPLVAVVSACYGLVKLLGAIL